MPRNRSKPKLKLKTHRGAAKRFKITSERQGGPGTFRQAPLDGNEEAEAHAPSEEVHAGECDRRGACEAHAPVRIGLGPSNASFRGGSATRNLSFSSSSGLRGIPRCARNDGLLGSFFAVLGRALSATAGLPAGRFRRSQPEPSVPERMQMRFAGRTSTRRGDARRLRSSSGVPMLRAIRVEVRRAG